MEGRELPGRLRWMRDARPTTVVVVITVAVLLLAALVTVPGLLILDSPWPPSGWRIAVAVLALLPPVGWYTAFLLTTRQTYRPGPQVLAPLLPDRVVRDLYAGREIEPRWREPGLALLDERIQFAFGIGGGLVLLSSIQTTSALLASRPVTELLVWWAMIVPVTIIAVVLRRRLLARRQLRRRIADASPSSLCNW